MVAQCAKAVPYSAMPCDPADVLQVLELLEAETAESLEIVDSPLFGIDANRRGPQHAGDGVLDVFAILDGVDPGAMQSSGVVIGQAGDVDF
jgi:hypothetical protein